MYFDLFQERGEIIPVRMTHLDNIDTEVNPSHVKDNGDFAKPLPRVRGGGPSGVTKLHSRKSGSSDTTDQAVIEGGQDGVG